MAIKRLCDVESHLGNSIDSFIFSVANDHWNVRKVALLRPIFINDYEKDAKNKGKED